MVFYIPISILSLTLRQSVLGWQRKTRVLRENHQHAASKQTNFLFRSYSKHQNNSNTNLGPGSFLLNITIHFDIMVLTDTIFKNKNNLYTLKIVKNSTYPNTPIDLLLYDLMVATFIKAYLQWSRCLNIYTCLKFRPLFFATHLGINWTKCAIYSISWVNFRHLFWVTYLGINWTKWIVYSISWVNFRPLFWVSIEIRQGLNHLGQ